MPCQRNNYCPMNGIYRNNSANGRYMEDESYMDNGRCMVKSRYTANGNNMAREGYLDGAIISPNGTMATNGGNYRPQLHVHEVQGSVMIAEPLDDPHNHRFATVTGEAIPVSRCDHVHDVFFRTDFYENHFHEFCGRTGGAIWVGDRHVHFLESFTTINDGHRHEFRFATFIDNPIED